MKNWLQITLFFIFHWAQPGTAIGQLVSAVNIPQTSFNEERVETPLRQLLADTAVLKNFWFTAFPPALSTYSSEDLELQKRINRQFDHEFVLTYNHSSDGLTFDKKNYQLPIQSSKIDNEEITPYTWKWVSLEMTETDGGLVKIMLRRPNWWILSQEADKIGNHIQVDIPEMGINGVAEVKDIQPSFIDTRIENTPELRPFRYRPITGWFERTAPEVWDYIFSTGDTISATPNHPFFSNDQQTYVEAGMIALGETVKIKGSQKAVLVSKNKRLQGPERVFNLEVWRDHNYFVGASGVLVHNSCADKLAEILGLDLGKLIKARKKDNSFYSKILMKEGGEIDHKDAEFLNEIGELINEDIVLPPKKTIRALMDLLNQPDKL